MSDNTSNPNVDAFFEDDPGSLDEVVDDDDDDLKLDSADTKVWLVKVKIYTISLSNHLQEKRNSIGHYRFLNFWQTSGTV